MGKPESSPTSQTVIAKIHRCDRSATVALNPYPDMTLRGIRVSNTLRA
jgi:hypothetical protein